MQQGGLSGVTPTQSSPFSQPTMQQNTQPQPFVQHYQQEQQQQQVSPMVETVEANTQQIQRDKPEAVEGSGIDARTETDPAVVAEQQIVSSGGAPGSAQGRAALLQSALNCRLPEFLLEGVLENPSLATVKDPAAAKVHAVNLLKLLTKDPGYGLKFKLVLDDIPAWSKYKSQDHSLFITGTEQKTDYFLTDGTNGEPTKLLTQG